jgi:hypothetical protein
MLKHIFERRLLISAGVIYTFVYTVLFIVQQPAVLQHHRLIRSTTFSTQATAIVLMPAHFPGMKLPEA